MSYILIQFKNIFVDFFMIFVDFFGLKFRDSNSKVKLLR